MFRFTFFLKCLLLSSLSSFALLDVYGEEKRQHSELGKKIELEKKVKEADTVLIYVAHQKDKSDEFNKYWDSKRAKLVEDKLSNMYKKIIYVEGTDWEDNKKMAELAEEIREYSFFDLFTFVHGGDQEIKSEWGWELSKQRVFYTEACNSAISLGKEKALISAGHSGRSASPIVSFYFIDNLAKGKSFYDSWKMAWDKMLSNLDKNISLLGVLEDYAGREIENDEFVAEAKKIAGTDMFSQRIKGVLNKDVLRNVGLLDALGMFFGYKDKVEVINGTRIVYGYRSSFLGDIAKLFNVTTSAEVFKAIDRSSEFVKKKI